MKNSDKDHLLTNNGFSVFLQKLFKKPRAVVLGLVVVVVLGFFLRRGLSKEKDGQEFQTVEVERGTIVSSVSASGQVLSVNVMGVTTKASGIVEEVYLRDGETVKAGDEILKIALDVQGQQKKAQAYSSYLSAKNTLESAKATEYTLQADMFGKWDVFKELAETDEYDTPEERGLPEFHIPEKEWLAAESKYKNQAAVVGQAKTAVNSAWLAYKLTSPVITAPTDGVITGLVFVKGMSIGALDMGNSQSNQKVATIQTEGKPIISVNLSEIDVSRVELGQKVTVILDSLPDKTFTGKVVGVDRIGTYASGVTQYPAVIQLDSGAAQILPNMAVTANVIIDVKDNVLLVPSGAVSEQEGQASVRLFKNGRGEVTPVELGLASDTQTEIVSGLQEGDLVVVGTISAGSGFPDDATSPFSQTRGGMGGMIRGGSPH